MSDTRTHSCRKHTCKTDGLMRSRIQPRCDCFAPEVHLNSPQMEKPLVAWGQQSREQTQVETINQRLPLTSQSMLVCIYLRRSPSAAGASLHLLLLKEPPQRVSSFRAKKKKKKIKKGGREKKREKLESKTFFGVCSSSL